MFTLDRGIDHIIVEDSGVYPVPKMAEAEELFFCITIDYRGAFTREHQSGF
jgi:hypothetical protein